MASPPSTPKHKTTSAGPSSTSRRRNATRCSSASTPARPKAPTGRSCDPKRFFRSVLLKQAVKIYYAHPFAWNEMGFGGPAAPRGYLRLGPDMRDPWEAREARRPQRAEQLP